MSFLSRNDLPSSGLAMMLPANDDTMQHTHPAMGRFQAKSLPASFLNKNGATY